MRIWLRGLNTHLTGYAGLTIGGLSLFGAIGALFKLLSNPDFLVALYGAILRGERHVETPADIRTFAVLLGALFAIFGAAVLALLASYLGMPKTIAPDSPKLTS